MPHEFFDLATSSGPSPLYRSRHSAMTRPPVERTYSSTFQIPARSVAPNAESLVADAGRKEPADTVRLPAGSLLNVPQRGSFGPAQPPVYLRCLGALPETGFLVTCFVLALDFRRADRTKLPRRSSL